MDRDADKILELNVVCPNCHYAIPASEIMLIVPDTVRCTQCRQAIALKPWVPVRFKQNL